jgi:N-acetylglucosamine-6-phosphate deacetylase
MKAIINGKIVTEENIIEGKVLLFHHKIVDIIDEKQLEGYKLKNDNMEIEVIDAGGRYIGAGFIDLHIHGSGGGDTMDGSLESLNKISATICQRGVTSFLPTTMTMEIGRIHSALDTIKEAMNIDMAGAKVIGAHMEGPFISEKYKGAQSASHIKKPDYEFVKDYLDVIKIITLAPEMDESYDFIKRIKKESDIVLSIGHSNATYEYAMKAIKNGIGHATHTFNAMTPLNHREPGIVGAIFNSDISCELIADTIHVHPDLFKLLVKIKGIEKVVLVTDCIRAGGMGEGLYDLGGQEVVVKDNCVRLSNGTLAGSVLDLNLAVKNMVNNTDLKIHEVMTMACLSPAKVIGIEDKKGSIKQGKDADIIIFDANFNIYTTIVEGKIVFKK